MIKNYNSNQKWNKDKRHCECKNPKECHLCGKYYIWNPTACTCENGKYLGNIIGDSVITCDEIIKVTKTAPIKIVPTKTTLTKTVSAKTIPIDLTCKTKKKKILRAFLLINVSLLIAVSIYYYKILSNTKTYIAISQR